MKKLLGLALLMVMGRIGIADGDGHHHHHLMQRRR